jgi:hypothetical protein
MEPVVDEWMVSVSNHVLWKHRSILVVDISSDGNSNINMLTI